MRQISISLGIGGRRRGGRPYDKPEAAVDDASIVITEDITAAPSVEVSADGAKFIILEAA